MNTSLCKVIILHLRTDHESKKPWSFQTQQKVIEKSYPKNSTISCPSFLGPAVSVQTKFISAAKIDFYKYNE